MYRPQILSGKANKKIFNIYETLERVVQMKKQFNEADVIGKPEQGSRERERYWRTYLEDFVSSNIGIPK